MSTTVTAAWKALEDHAANTRTLHMRDLFAQDATRFDRMHVRLNDMVLDYSKNRVTDETLRLLFDLARACRVEEWRAKMFSGDKINNTEGRAVLHTALRASSGHSVKTDGKAVMPEVTRVLQQMRVFSEAVRSGTWRGCTGQRITDVVNIGIGGSDLWPVMATEALRPYWKEGLRVHFVSNVDPADLASVLAGLNPATTLFVVASKTFTTLETLSNARTARAW